MREFPSACTCLLIFSHLLMLILFPSSISSLPFSNAPLLDPNFMLIGDAKIINGGSSVQLTDPNTSSPSSGLLIRNKRFSFLSSNAKTCRPVSFSTDFTFSISGQNADGLALVIVPVDFPSKLSRESFGLSGERRYIGIEFDTFVDGNVGDQNANHVGVDVGSLVSAKVSNVSSINLLLGSGMKLHSWVDYDSSSKRLEIRLGKFGDARPYDPLLAHQIDLGEMWKAEEVLFGLSSSSGNSAQSSNVYSWNFGSRIVPKWLHSQPVDPRVFTKEKLEEKKRSCILRFLPGLILAFGCGAMAAFVVLFLWVIFANMRDTMIPRKKTVHPGDFRYEQINVVVKDNQDDVKNQSF